MLSEVSSKATDGMLTDSDIVSQAHHTSGFLMARPHCCHQRPCASVWLVLHVMRETFLQTFARWEAPQYVFDELGCLDYGFRVVGTILLTPGHNLKSADARVLRTRILPLQAHIRPDQVQTNSRGKLRDGAIFSYQNRNTNLPLRDGAVSEGCLHIHEVSSALLRITAIHNGCETIAPVGQKCQYFSLAVSIN